MRSEYQKQKRPTTTAPGGEEIEQSRVSPKGLVGNVSIGHINQKNLSVQEALAIFVELPSNDDSAASNNSDTDDEDYVESVAQGENISSNDEEMDEVQCPTSQPKSNGGKLYYKK
ncbi:hypothetical protein TNIN_198381 [Trichonephila inaurata madagascariensis]|uniref:Uncharacterized protein n=1 Tax=Trichonephila inaurata madagascariensis TaxID=2747483 RepID=A0A8X6IJF8_9ARAC|nr:hypothetical protein TNIN_198381 [Trichonephila inaurata madagascariensis]